MNVKKWIALLCIALTIVCFAGCGASEASKDYNGSMEYGSAGGALGLTDTVKNADSELPVEQKLIRTVYMSAETNDMDGFLPQIQQRVSELGGYVESQEVYNGSAGSSRSRYANFVIRIPAQQLDQFVSQVSDVSNIVSKSETTEDVTLSYIEVQGRISALETEQTRLLELLAMAETMDDLLLIESRLTEVRAELEKVNSTLRLYDNQVNYGTIHLDVDEVVEYTEEEPEGFWARIGNGFVKSMKNAGTIITELIIFMIVATPYMIPLVFIGAVAGVVLLIIRSARKKRRKKQSQE